MNVHVKRFLLRGAIGVGIGNIIGMLIALIIGSSTGGTEMTIYTYAAYTAASTAIGFVFGGVNVVFDIERLSLLAATVIHFFVLGAVFYACALPAGWIPLELPHVMISLGVFLGAYIVIWFVVMGLIRRNAGKMNEALKK